MALCRLRRPAHEDAFRCIAKVATVLLMLRVMPTIPSLCVVGFRLDLANQSYTDALRTVLKLLVLLAIQVVGRDLNLEVAR